MGPATPHPTLPAQSGAEAEQRGPHPLSTEVKEPEKSAEFISLRAEGLSIAEAAKRAGLPYDAARGLEKRLESKYREVVESITPITDAALEGRLSHRLDMIHGYLTPQTMDSKLSKATIAQIGVYEGIMLDKLFNLRGKPTSILRVEDSQKLDTLAVALLDEVKKRGVSAKLVERTAEVILREGTGPRPGTTEPTDRPADSSVRGGASSPPAAGPAVQPA